MPQMSYIAITAIETERMREKFNKDMDNYFILKSSKPAWTAERVKDVIKNIDMYNARDPAVRDSSRSYYYFYNYEVKTINGKRVLVPKNKANVYGRIIPSDQYFDIIMHAHMETGHGGRQKMFHYVKGEVFIPSVIMGLFPKHCQICSYKKAIQRGWGAGMMPDHKLGYVGIIDMTTAPDDSEWHKKYKYILYYMDQTTKYTNLHALATDCVDEIASALLVILLDNGGPALLHTYDHNLTRNLISALTMLFPKYTILSIQKQMQVEEQEKRKNQVKDSVLRWMAENKSSAWSMGIRYVANSWNTTYDDEIKRTPYEAVFGYKYQKTGLSGLGLPEEVLSTIKTEDDLKGVLRKETIPFVPKTRTGPKVGDTLDSEYPWCCVCEYEDEDVAYMCHTCNGAIHRECGVTNGLMEVTCNLCLQNQTSPEPEEVIELPEMTIKEAAEMMYEFQDENKE